MVPSLLFPAGLCSNAAFPITPAKELHFKEQQLVLPDSLYFSQFHCTVLFFPVVCAFLLENECSYAKEYAPSLKALNSAWHLRTAIE